jgi:hypothetical protein
MENLPNRGVTIKVTKHQMRRNELGMRLAVQEVLQNAKRIEIEDRFQKKIYDNRLL